MMDLYEGTDLSIITKIGEKIKSVRLGKNLSQLEVAERAGLTLRTVRNIESGKPFSMIAFLQVLRALGVLDLIEELVVVQDTVSPRLLYRNLPKKRRRASRKKKDNTNENNTEW